MSQHRFSLFFRLKKSKKYSKGNITVYMRITVNAARVELSTNREFDPERWNAILGRAMGKKEDALTLNAYLDTLQIKVHEAHRQILASNDIPTAEKIKNILTGKDVERPRLLLEIFAEHNSQMEKLISKEEYAKGTLTHFRTTLKHTRNFIDCKYSLVDMTINKIDFAFIHDFEFYLKSEICAQKTQADGSPGY